jgi:hypothetical protein
MQSGLAQIIELGGPISFHARQFPVRRKFLVYHRRSLAETAAIHMAGLDLGECVPTEPCPVLAYVPLV